ncbi:MAG: A/G-specific adenine glycosylase [Microscillaceae bacterium]|nr:A/G-specific adenine glycosylase [Microscillaceae bacterium]MDW8460473.1 A/G-specific adenine glycosylase [Cytophagales bacterium]
MENKWFSERLLAWFSKYQRELPWRNTTNPYYIWLSEVILQQTRVKQGLPYYEKFIQRYPTIQHLAQADLQDVMRLWQGLGYYSRAKNMHSTAQWIVANRNGEFPRTFQELLKLKGIGQYTAAAIASFAFHEKIAVLDGNVYRVLARIFGIETDITTSKAQKEFTQLANALLPEQNSHLHNQAVMEFGAIHCTPQNPQCFFCIFQDKCIAFEQNKQETLPIKTQKTKTKQRFFNYIVINFQNKIALKQRKDKDIWQNLYDFYLIETAQEVTNWNELTAIEPTILENSLLQSVSITYKHVLTHQTIWAKFWHITLQNEHLLPNFYQFYTLQEINQLPKPILIHQYLNEKLQKIETLIY